jgi:tetratricopeptide (TPR) repeat protein
MPPALRGNVASVGVARPPAPFRRLPARSWPSRQRVRPYAVVAACALAAAGLTVGVTLATRTPTPSAPRQAAPRGAPPLVLELGVRIDPEAVALRRAADLYNRGKRRQARAIFARYRSIEARVGAAFAAWPTGFGELRTLASRFPDSALVQLDYGLALVWRNEDGAAERAWRAARAVQPDTPYAVRAQDLLYPNFPRGLPTFVPSFPAPAGIGKLSPPRQLALLAAGARTGGVRAKLLYGVALQRLGHQISALRQYQAAAAVAPADPEPKVAVAVARFDKANPSRTFSQLGPLARVYPGSQTVHFHLGLCLLWLGSVKEARAQLRTVLAAGRRTTLGVEAQRFLTSLANVGTR